MGTTFQNFAILFKKIDLVYIYIWTTKFYSNNMKLIFTFLFFLIYTYSFGQIVTIPDVNFKNALVNNNCADFDGDLQFDGDVDTNNDGEIQFSEAEALIGLQVGLSNIISMQGIEAFTNLENLSCGDNLIQTLNLSQNPNLKHLICWDNQITDLTVSGPNVRIISCDNNQITNLDVTQCPNLSALYAMDNELSTVDLSNNLELGSLWIFNNQLTSLDVSNNANLRYLECKINSLTELDLSNNVNLTHLECQSNSLETLNLRNGNNEILTTMNSTLNPSLTCINVDDASASRPECIAEDTGWCVGAGVEYSTDCIPLDFPDVNFENALTNTLSADFDGDFTIDGDVDSNDDGFIQVSEAEAVIGLYVEDNNIISLEGLSEFKNMKHLFAQNNPITSIDLTQNEFIEIIDLSNCELGSLSLENTSIIAINLNNNNLTEIDISQNVNLEILKIEGNNINDINFSNNTLLREVNISSNNLSILDLSNNQNLETLRCNDNQLENLDFSNIQNIGYLNCSNNSLLNLDLRNGFNAILQTMISTGNNNLFCLNVDNENANLPVCQPSTLEGWCLDPWSEVNEDCTILGIESYSLEEIIIYPNPTNNFLNINFSISIDQINIYSIDGRMIKEAFNVKKIDVSELANGIYLIRIGIKNQKLLKEFIKY